MTRQPEKNPKKTPQIDFHGARRVDSKRENARNASVFGVYAKAVRVVRGFVPANESIHCVTGNSAGGIDAVPLKNRCARKEFSLAGRWQADQQTSEPT
ncbi:hypothetical protein [Paraburkholderia bannensis]|uniref:hypothetical protein n=1 Tax=Paraburkholderia bannensis TaxID=765414 RepID=UPI002ABE4F30|nr:hypothetical protein [Paraburkholderia bannensis]